MRVPGPPLCFHLFSAADAADSRSLPEWRHSREMQQETGLVMAFGSKLYSHLLFGSSGQFAANRDAILREVACFLGFSAVRRWYHLHPYLEELFGQFFGHAKCRSWPAFVWAMPTYVSTGYGLQLWKVPPKDRVLDYHTLQPTRDYLPRFPLQFNPYTQHPRLDLDLGSVSFVDSQRHGSGAARRILWMERERSGILRNGRPLRSAFEQNLGLAEPDDDAECLAGGYYPAHDGLRVVGNGGRTQFINFLVLILARVYPVGSWYRGIADQVVVSLHPQTGCTVDFNIVDREAELFLRHYPGLRPLVCKVLGIEESD